MLGNLEGGEIRSLYESISVWSRIVKGKVGKIY